MGSTVHTSDGFSSKDSRNRSREPLVPSVVSHGSGNRNREHLWGCPARPLEAKIAVIFFLRCRSASENVFLEILDQISGVSLT